MIKQRLVNGSPEKGHSNPVITLHSLLKTYLETNAAPRSLKDVMRNNPTIEYDENADQQEFQGLIKGKSLKHGRHALNKKLSMEMLDHPQKRPAEKSLRPVSKKVFVAKNKVQVKSKITDNKNIKIFFRNQIISLMAILNRREDYLNRLKGKKTEAMMPMKSPEVQQAFMKLIESKGKDLGRIKFNFNTNQQLRSLKYKAKVLPTVNLSKKSKIKNGDYVDVDSAQQEEEEDYKQENIDMATWKRRNGCGYNQKVFVVKGGYHQLRRTLIERGWFQNDDVWSNFYDLRWTTQSCDINFAMIKPNQIVNHFNNNHHLTSKYGISRRLKTLIIPYGIDVDKFYPRCYDLGDRVDFQNFIENFKFSFAQSVTKRFLVEKQRYNGLQVKIKIVYDILKRRLASMAETVNNINNGVYPLITPEEWEIITETVEWEEQQLKEKLMKMREDDQIEILTDDENYQQKYYDWLDKQFRVLLQKLQVADPQLTINGFRNVWIAKPNFLSRGRGIKCMNNLYDIANYCLGKDCQFVIQKYIQNPLLVGNRKFDIRQWVLIQNFNPPVIWFYEECYFRFCTDDYSLDNIHNKFMHLTNNSIQKYHKKGLAEDSMWQMAAFIEYVGADKWKQIQQKIKNIIVWSIKSCEGSVTGKKGFFEMVGYDFMIDENLNPWIIEINMSPSMDHSTPVTKRLVDMVQRDTANLLASSAKKKQKNAGLWTCIYKSDQDLPKFSHYKQ